MVIERTAQLGAFMRSFAEVVRLPPPLLQPTDLGAVLAAHRAAAQRQPSAGSSGSGSSNERAVPVPMDRSQMEQVLVNVVKNALEAIGRGAPSPCASRTPRPAGARHRGHRPRDRAEARAHLFTPFFSTKPTVRASA